MTAGEYISVASQKDAEEADIEKERAEQQKGPHARMREFEELVGSGSSSAELHKGSGLASRPQCCHYLLLQIQCCHYLLLQISTQHVATCTARRVTVW